MLGLKRFKGGLDSREADVATARLTLRLQTGLVGTLLGVVLLEKLDLVGLPIVSTVAT